MGSEYGRGSVGEFLPRHDGRCDGFARDDGDGAGVDGLQLPFIGRVQLRDVAGVFVTQIGRRCDTSGMRRMLADEKAGISEHSVVFPIDSIKVSRSNTQLVP